MIVVTRVDELLTVLARPDATDDEEDVAMLAHLLQTAAQLETDAPDDVELQVAGLVHDVGTILEPGQPTTHARTGANAVVALLGSRVADLVAQHDRAKRYLVTAEATYRHVLSSQSIATLAVQGGPLDDSERRAFEQQRDFDAYVRLRRADDQAKVPGKVVPPLDYWRPALERCAQTRTSP